MVVDSDTELDSVVSGGGHAASVEDDEVVECFHCGPDRYTR